MTKCDFSLTVSAQGSCQHLDALVSDGVSGSEVRGQWTPGRRKAGRHGAGWGGGGFRGISFSLPVKKKEKRKDPSNIHCAFQDVLI